MFQNRRFLVLLMFAAIASSGCTRLFYASMKKLGKDKRDILVSRILDAKKAQEEASKQFASALEAFQAVTNFNGGDLEKAYNKLNGEYESAQERAKKVTERVDAIDKVLKDLFKEWDGEIDKMSDGKLKNDSRALLRDSEQRNRELLRQMRASEAKMKPVLSEFYDHVVFLKHNLNAQAIGSLKTQATSIDGEVDSLIKEMETSNQAADRTIAGLNADSE